MHFLLLYRIAKFYSTEFLVYPLETVALTMRRIFEVGLLLLFWYIVSQDNTIQNLQIVPYILIASGVQFLSVGHNFRQAFDIHEDIKSGRLNNILIRPINELVYEFGVYLGRNILEFVFSFINILIGILFLTGLDGAKLLLFIISLVPAFLIGYSVNILVASVSFWLVESYYFRLLAYFMLRVVSGLFIPLTFFTGFWGVVLQYGPLAHLAFVPSYTLSGDNINRSVALIAVGFVWSLVLFKFARFIWCKGVKQYGAVGI